MRTKIQKLVFLAFSFLLLLLALMPAVKSVAAADGFPVAPPADTAGLNMRDYFVVSTANPGDFPNKARFSTAYPQALVVTPNTYNGWQIGGIWSKNKIDLNSPFTYNTEHYFGDTSTGNDAAADGMTFTLQNDPLGQGAYGSPGGGLGAYPWSTNGKNTMIKNYIRNGLSIEMDDWLNNSNVADDQFDIDLQNTNSNGHLAVVRPGDTPLKSTNSATVGHLQYSFLPVPLANKTWKKFSVSWAPKVTYTNGVRILGGTLTYSLTNSAPGVATPQITTQTFTIPNVLTYFNSDHVYYGYTGATGRNKTFQAVSVMKTPQTAKPVTVRYVDPSGNNLKEPITMNGEIGDSWDASTNRQQWLKSGNDWYEYNGNYDSNVSPKKDAGIFSATTPYTVTYHYEKRTPPEKFALVKTARNTDATRGSTTFSDNISAQKNDVIEFKIDFANLLAMKQGTITDLLPSGFSYKDGSLSISDDDTNGQYVPLDDTTFKQNGKIKFPYDMADGQGFSIKFSATVMSTVGSLKNTATVTPTGTGNPYTTPPVTVNVSQPPRTYHLHKYTVPTQGGTQPVAGATYQLTDPNGTDTQTVGPSGSDGNANFSIKDFTTRIFTLKETNAPAGYQLDPTTYELQFDGAGQYFTGLRVKGAANQGWQMTAQGSPNGGNINLPSSSTDTINAYDTAAPLGPALQKSVRNVTYDDSQPFTESALADPGDTVEYQVDFTNQLGMTSPVLTDLLSQDLSFVPGTIQIASSANGYNYTLQPDGTFGNNGQLKLPTNMAVGDKVSVRFDATVNDPGLLSTIPNTARVDDTTTPVQATVSNVANVTVPRYSGIMITKYDQDTNTGSEMNGAVFDYKLNNSDADYASATGYDSTAPTGQGMSNPGMDMPDDGQTPIAMTIPSLSEGFPFSEVFDVKETTAPAGYAVNDKVYQVRWSADWTRREMRVNGVREKPSDPWSTDETPDGKVFVDDGQLGFRDQQSHKITVQTYDRVTHTTTTMGTYKGDPTQKLTDVHPGANIPGSITDRDLWGYTIGQTFDPNAQLNAYDPNNIPDPQFGDTDLVLTYVYDQKMFELNPDPEINFGNFADNAVDRDYLLGENHTQTNQPIPFGVSATDRIGIRDWTLSVSEDGQFDNNGHKLDNAQLEFNNMKVADKKNDGSDVGSVNLFTTTNDFTLNSDGTPLQIAHVRTLPLSSGQALYTQNLRFDFGDMNTGGNSVRVNVPRTTTRYRGQYNTSLTWTAAYLP
ncbi:SpaA isopeptide-forming pilin-related protein [Lacticaseibacillus pabuli]|uniref:SpaA isopeptide-forming pilin-related protein n=1 Tax=Lacticaseibacillus pabuli TaxID=3025672 RepID=A0ABY7WRJ7_9LACO|nr:SpaA isopeptide-forming pilin-related protein [Lacticaseibacillus sp. KACC 23028]WDF82414.1 SpaA isopeptide-forming pilin-related protein [Lacticaseibacillus sp. KACC 23028]